MYVNVPWTDTTYSAGTGLSLSGTTFNHSNSVTAGTVGTSSATNGATTGPHLHLGMRLNGEYINPMNFY